MEALGIDIRGLIFQLVNFLALLFILTKLLHKPLQKLMADRSKAIQEGLENAARAKAQLEEADIERQKLLDKADKEGKAMLEAVRDRASKLEDSLRAEAQEKAEKLLARNKEEMENEREKIKTELRGELAELVVTATERVLESPIPTNEKRKQVQKLVAEIKP